MPAPVRLGVAGFGVAGRVLLPFVDQHPDVVVTAVADPREQARAEALSLVGGSAVATVEELCQRDDVDAVYVATPTQLHAEHAVLAASSGKAVVVEKPMATSIAEALAIVEAADSAGVTLVVGHSQSFEAPVRAMRDLVAGGSLGRLRAINAWYFTDWMYRPRHPDELDPDQGGGVTMRQAAHHVDIVRHLGGGLLRSVRAMTGVWDPSRRSDGSYSAYLEFEDSTPATVFYSGYDHFPSAELTFGLGEAGQPLGEDYAVARRRLREVHSPEGELALKTGASAAASWSCSAPATPSPSSASWSSAARAVTCGSRPTACSSTTTRRAEPCRWPTSGWAARSCSTSWSQRCAAVVPRSTTAAGAWPTWRSAWRSATRPCAGKRWTCTTRSLYARRPERLTAAQVRCSQPGGGTDTWSRPRSGAPLRRSEGPTSMGRWGR